MFSIEARAVPFPYRPIEGLSTGFSQLDAQLQAGIPRGRLVEISGEASSGKATLALGIAQGLLEQGKAVCWIDAGAHFWPLASLEARGSLGPLFVLRVPDGRAAVKGAQLLLGCPGAVSLLVVDLPPAGPPPKDLQLLKLQRLAEHAGAGLVFLTERPARAPSLGASVALRLHVRRGTSLGLRIEVLRHKGGASQQILEEAIHGPDRVCVDSSL